MSDKPVKKNHDFIRWWMREGAQEWARLVDISGSALYPWEMVFNAGASESAKRIATLEAAQQWVPVTERLPENGRSVLCCYTGVYNHRVAVYWVDAGGNGHFQCKEKGSQPVTHWMPLPTPPAAQGEQL